MENYNSKDLVKLINDGSFEIGELLHLFSKQSYSDVIEKTISFFEIFYKIERDVYAIESSAEGTFSEAVFDDISNIKWVMSTVENFLVTQNWSEMELFIARNLAGHFQIFQNDIRICLDLEKKMTVLPSEIWFSGNITLQLSVESQVVHLNIAINSQQIEASTVIENYDYTHSNYLFYWLIYHLKPVFDLLPIGNLSTNIQMSTDIEKKPVAKQFFNEVLERAVHILTTTSQLIGDFAHMKDCLAAEENGLFFILETEEHTRLGEFIKHWKESYGEKTFVETFPSGWDAKKREWVQKSHKFDILQFMKSLVERDIHKIISMNHYYLDNALGDCFVYIPTLMKFLGVELVQLFFDPVEYDQVGQLKRRCYGIDNLTHYSVLPLISKDWDEAFKQNNIFYTPIVQHFSKNTSNHYKTLPVDYDILVMSQSRVSDVKTALPYILYVLDNIDYDNPFEAYQLWFLAMRKRLFALSNVNEKRWMSQGQYLHILMYRIANFLKYEVINRIKTDKKIRIYGDQGWEQVFPQYYEKKYLTGQEMLALDAENKSLHLLFHNNFSYLETGGPVFDAIAKGRPFINYGAVSRTEPYQGFKCIEYGNAESLNQLINHYHDQINIDALDKALKHYNDVMSAAESQIAEHLFNGTPFDDDGGIYYTECKAHYPLLQEKIDQFEKQYHAFLDESVTYVFEGKPLIFDVTQSEFFKREYVQRLYNSK